LVRGTAMIRTLAVKCLAMSDEEEAGSKLEGSEELSKAQSWLQLNPSVAISIVALLISIGSFLQAKKSAENSSAQVKLASRPVLYGACNHTRNDFLKHYPEPNALWIALKPETELQIETLMLVPVADPGYEMALPFIIDKCSLANVGKGSASNVEIGMKIIFVDPTTMGAYPRRVTQHLTIPYLGPGEKYEFVVGDKGPAEALILMPLKANFDVSVTGEHLEGEPILHNDDWIQLTTRNSERPKGLKANQ
jgi:hypothetical protein